MGYLWIFLVGYLAGLIAVVVYAVVAELWRNW